MTQVSEDIRGAMVVLDARGWCQGVVQPNADGNVCIEAALAKVILGASHAWSERGGSTNYSPEDVGRYMSAIHALREALPDEAKKHSLYRGPNRPDDIYWWNDLKSTTVEDVKLLMKRAIEAEEANA